MGGRWLPHCYCGGREGESIAGAASSRFGARGRSGESKGEASAIRAAVPPDDVVEMFGGCRVVSIPGNTRMLGAGPRFFFRVFYYVAT